MSEIDEAEVIAVIQHLAENNDDIEVVWLYGSRARQQAHQGSDFDIAIAFKNFNLSAVDKYLRPNELALEWAAILKLPEKILGVIDINQSPVYLNINVINEGEVVYTAASSRLYREHNRISSQYEYQLVEMRHE